MDLPFRDNTVRCAETSGLRESIRRYPSICKGRTGVSMGGGVFPLFLFFFLIMYFARTEQIQGKGTIYSYSMRKEPGYLLVIDTEKQWVGQKTNTIGVGNCINKIPRKSVLALLLQCTTGPKRQIAQLIKDLQVKNPYRLIRSDQSHGSG